MSIVVYNLFFLVAAKEDVVISIPFIIDLF